MQIAIEYKMSNNQWILVDEVGNTGSYNWDISDDFEAEDIKLRDQDASSSLDAKTGIISDTFHIN